MLTLNEIQNRIAMLAAQIGAADALLPTSGQTEDGARPHLEADERGYHYVVVERGQELERFTTSNPDDLLYRVFAGVTFALATRHEASGRRENQDSRRELFGRQLELLALLSESWAARERQRQAEILRRNPYDDNVHRRAHLARTYREQGFAAEAAWQQACEQYPLPEH